MPNREPKYWRLHPAVAPGDVVAEHDGGVGLDDDETSRSLVSGPGNYKVIVRRPGADVPGAPMPRRWPIELAPVGLTASSAPIKMNPGMARWFGLRLIEAAAICESFDVTGGGSPSVAPAEIEKLAAWMQSNAADWIKGSAVDSAIALLSHAKGIVHDQSAGLDREQAEHVMLDRRHARMDD